MKKSLRRKAMKTTKGKDGRVLERGARRREASLRDRNVSYKWFGKHCYQPQAQVSNHGSASTQALLLYRRIGK
jgi:hypothetical protein